MQVEAQSPVAPSSRSPNGRRPMPDSLREFRLYRPRAGHPDWPRLQNEARALANDLRPTLAPPRGGIAEARRRARAFATAARNYIRNRQRARAGR